MKNFFNTNIKTEKLFQLKLKNKLNKNVSEKKSNIIFSENNWNVWIVRYANLKLKKLKSVKWVKQFFSNLS